jgi:uncharacterized metal-binding protein
MAKLALILDCSRGSNVGQLSTRATVDLAQEGFGKMFCVAGIGAQLSGFVQSAKDVPAMVAIDGCQVGCANAVLKNARADLKHSRLMAGLLLDMNCRLKVINTSSISEI